MSDTFELIRRVSTIRLSRISTAHIVDARLDWYILGDCKPNYPMPVIRYKAQIGLGIVVIKRVNEYSELIVKHWV